MRWLNVGKLNRPHPKFLACPAVEAIQVSLLSLIFRAGDEDAPMRNDGAAVTRTRKGRLPADVFPRSPMERRFVLLSNTIPERPAELRPIVCPRCQGQQQGKRSGLKNLSAIRVQGNALSLTDLLSKDELEEWIGVEVAAEFVGGGPKRGLEAEVDFRAGTIAVGFGDFCARHSWIAVRDWSGKRHPERQTDFICREFRSHLAGGLPRLVFRLSPDAQR